MRAGELNKDVLRVLRFRNTLLQFGVKERWAGRTHGRGLSGPAVPGSHALFAGRARLYWRTSGRTYALHIITNGFHECAAGEVAGTAGYTDHFDVVLSSEMAGAGKPDPRIFRRALELAGARCGARA
jgi:FMN phosphatase YigB (HAD superfamily)